MARKQKPADLEVDGVQLDPQPNGNFDHSQPRNSQPKRTGTGKGRAIEQLEKYGDAVLHAVPKRPHLMVPLSEPINNLVLSPKKQNLHSKVKPAKEKDKAVLVSLVACTCLSLHVPLNISRTRHPKVCSETHFLLW